MPLARITTRQFEAFVAVADELSFAAAGERLGLSASAVSQLIAELEATIGFRTFDRSTRRVALSSAGREILGPAQNVLRQIRLAEVAAEDVRNRAAGIVRVGAPLVMASMILPAAVREFNTERPKVVVHIQDAPVDAMVDRVATGELDLALGPDRPQNPAVLRESIFGSPWVLWCAPWHALAKKPAVQWEDLRAVRLVAAGRDHEVSVAQMRRDAPVGQTIAPLDVVDNITTAFGIAAQGLAATLAPAYVGAIAQPFGLVMRHVTDPETIRYVSLYRPTQRSIPPAAGAFAEFVKPWVARWNETVVVRRSRSRHQQSVARKDE